MSSNPAVLANPFSEILQATFEALTSIDNDIRCANPLASAGATQLITVGGQATPLMSLAANRIEAAIYNTDAATTLYVGYQRTVTATGVTSGNATGFPVAPGGARLYDRHTAPLARWGITTGAQIQVSLELLTT